MKRIHRQRLSLFMSMIMTVFLICQGQALAMQVASPPAASMMSSMPGCQESHKDSSATSGCHGECQHVQSHANNGGNPHAVDSCVVIVVYMQPWLTQEPGSITLASLPPHDPVSDPPPLLRFLHFRE